jgi:hypothetical protein
MIKLAASHAKSKIVDLKKFVLIIDTMEKENSHIVEFMKANNVSYIRRKLDFGDYSFEYDGKSYEKLISIERKNSLEELSGNLFKWNERFENEHNRSKGSRFYWMIESGSVTNIYAAAYEEHVNKHGELVKADSNAFIGKVLAMQCRHGFQIDFVGKEYIGKHIMNVFFYYLRSILNLRSG